MVNRDVRVRVLARVSLDAAIAQVRANERAARAGGDPEATHQLRVGVRRLRVVLRLFEAQVGAVAARKLIPDLKWVFTKLGVVRDHDVLIETAAAAPLGEGASALRAALIHERDKAARAAARVLKTKRYAELVRALRRLSLGLSGHDAPSPRARKWLRKRLDKRLARVLAREAALYAEDEAALHDLRKELKKLRYTADLTRGLWSDKRTARYLKRLSRLQDVLGPVNDATVGRHLLEGLGEHLDASAAEAAAALTATLAERVERKQRDLPRAFAKLADIEPYWQ
ncbi:MAG: CHAD domain-containing protein [Polyangiales bacterium]